MYKKPWTCRNSCLLWVMSFGLQKIRIKCKGWNLNQLLKRKIPGNSMQISPWGFPGNCFLLLFEYLELCSSTAVSAAGSGNSTGSHWTCIHAGRFTELTCLSLVQYSTLTQQQSYTQTDQQNNVWINWNVFKGLFVSTCNHHKLDHTLLTTWLK